MTNATLRCSLAKKAAGMFLCVAGLSAAVGSASAENLKIGEDESHTVSGSESYEKLTLLGKLTVPNGASITTTEDSIGANGSNPLITLDGGAFNFTSLAVEADSYAGQSTYADVFHCDGASSIAGRLRENKNTDKTARIRIDSGTTKLSVLGWSQNFFKGNWCIEIADGATAYFELGWCGYVSLVEGNKPLTFVGAGDITYLGYRNSGDDTTFMVGSSDVSAEPVSFNNTGKIVVLEESSQPIRFYPNVVFGTAEGRPTLELSGSVEFMGNMSLPSVTSKSRNGILSGTGEMTFGALDDDATLTGQPFPSDTALTVKKAGTGTLTLSDTTTWLPRTEVAAGTLRIGGHFTCAGLTVASGASVTVDGGRWIITGRELTTGSGATLSTVNGGTISLRVTDDDRPDLGGLAELTVNSYWVNGVQQPAGGDYTLGQTKIIVTPATATDASYVPADAVYTASGAEAYETIDIEGKLIVPSGTSVTAPTVDFGKTEPAEVVVSGTFGTLNGSSVTLGAAGGSPCVTVDGGTFSCGAFTVAEESYADAPNVADVFVMEGDATFTSPVRKNRNADKTAQIRVLSGEATFHPASYYGNYFSGLWRIDVAEGATAFFSKNFYGGVNLVEGTKSLTFLGAGDVRFAGFDVGADPDMVVGTDNAEAEPIRFDNCGKIILGGMIGLDATVISTCFHRNVVFGDSLKEIELYCTAKFVDVDLKLPSVTSLNVTRGFLSGTGSVTFGSGDHDATVTGAAFPTDSELAVTKVGTGTLMLSATTPYLPATAVEGGTVRICGSFSSAGLTLSAGASVVVDGGSWTIDGAQLTSVAGASVTTVNNGRIVLKTYDGNAPDLAGLDELDVVEYWVNGVRQANGRYTLGTTTIVADSFEEDDLGIWRAGDPTSFPSVADYRGMELSSATAFSATTDEAKLRLGSAGIVGTTVDASMTNVFAVPLVPMTNETWNFGAANASFLAPILNPTGIRWEIPSLEVKSSGLILLASAQSTFTGPLKVEAKQIAVTGEDALGGASDASADIEIPAGALNPSATWDHPLTANVIFRDAVVNRPLSIRTSDDANNHMANISFSGRNEFNGFVTFKDACTQFTVYGEGSVVEFNGGLNWDNYAPVNMAHGSTIIVRGRITRQSDYGLFFPNVLSGTATIVFDCAVELPKPDMVMVRELKMEFLRDYAFAQGYLMTSDHTELRLNGHNQCFSRLDISEGDRCPGTGAVSSTNEAAELEFSAPSADMPLHLVFTDLAGVRLTGAGTMSLDAESPAQGLIGATDGTLTVKANWPNAAAIEAVGQGTVVIPAGIRVGGTLASVTLSGTGGLRNDSGRRLKTDKLTLTDPTTGETFVCEDGYYDASNTFGLVKSGVIKAGHPQTGGLLLIR